MKRETVLLGCVAADAPKYIEELIDILKPEYFSTPQLKDLWRAIEGLYSASKPINILSLTEYSEKEKYSITALEIMEIANVPKFLYLDEAEHIAQAIKMDALKVAFNSGVMGIAAKLTNQEIELDEAITDHEALISEITTSSVSAEYVTVAESINEVIKDINDRGKRTGISGIPSGFNKLDELTDGFQGGQMVIWAGRPAMGKTTSALQMALNMTKQGKKVLVFSLEMKDDALVKKIISSEAGVNHKSIKTGKLSAQEWANISDSVPTLSKLDGLMINKNYNININTMRATIKKVKRSVGLDAVIVDYIQLVQSGDRYKGNRVLEVGQISRILKKTALELSIPIIALSQLSRAVEQRAGGVPMLSDLRETGDLEQDADAVIFNYRPSYYNVESTIDGKDTQNLFQLLIAKNREGELGTIDLICDLGKSKIWNETENTFNNPF